MLRSLRKITKRNDIIEQLIKKHCKQNVEALSTFLPSRLASSQATTQPEKEKSVLYRNLVSRIKAGGAITVADYMREVLTHPHTGYYINKDVFGEKGDFTTSPEISQLFGEMVAVWIINEWTKIGRPPLQLVELGPGRGSLSKDILRVFKQLRFLEQTSLHLVEISPTLSTLQANNVCTSTKETNPYDKDNVKNAVTHYREGVTHDGVKVFWYYAINDVPTNFSVFIAHEFFDALPIHKFQKSNRGWNEILVDIDQTTEEEKFRFVMSNAATPGSKIYITEDEKRDHVEISPQSAVIMDYMSTFLEENGGFSLITDYGHNGEKTDTFRAFHKHKLHDPLLNPGTADLTADVDFSLLKRIAQKDDRLISFGPVNQMNFLKQLGIDVRLEVLLKNAPEDQKRQIQSGYHMIMDEDKMGRCFKMLALFPSVLKEHLEKWPVAGFQ